MAFSFPAKTLRPTLKSLKDNARVKESMEYPPVMRMFINIVYSLFF